MNFIIRLIWSFLRVFANALTAVGLIGVIGSIAIMVFRSIDMILYEKENEE